jgi:hypothetical protein
MEVFHVISSVFLSGRLGKVVKPKVRYVEVDRVIPGPTGTFEVDRFPVKSMLSVDGPFMKMPEGSYICLKGRLEMDSELGLVIVDEIDELYSLPEGMKKI